MEEIVRQVMAAVEKSGLVEIEVSARHVHLTQSDFEILFGKGKTMTPKRDLSQPGQYLAAERVDIIAPSFFPLISYTVVLPLYMTPVHQILKCYLVHHTTDGIIQLFPQDKCHTAFLPRTVLSSFIQTVHRT